jgi:hypothetical protein
MVQHHPLCIITYLVLGKKDLSQNELRLTWALLTEHADIPCCLDRSVQ